MKLDGRVALVTGGGHGLGEALCAGFAARGARGLVVVDIDGVAHKANDFDSWIRQLQGWHDQLQPDVGAE